MTEPKTDPPYDIVISDAAMQSIRELPPEAVDELADAFAKIRTDPMAGTRAVLPHPVDHAEDREDTPVPATRSVSYLRNAVAEISPPTVAAFDEELREDAQGDTPEDRLRGLRRFLMRWIEYIAVQGDHATGRALADAEQAAIADPENDVEPFAELFGEVMERVHREHFPDAADNPTSLAIRVAPHGSQWKAVCPITMIRVIRDNEEAARTGLEAALHRLLSGI